MADLGFSALRRSSLVSSAALIFALALSGALAQGQSPAPQRPANQQQEQAQRQEAPRLPPDSVTLQKLDVRGATLRYTATAGSLPLLDEQNHVLVEIAYVAYVLDGREAASRPITFAFNGGPGASSAYLHFGALGPKRLAFGNQDDVPSKPPVLADNPDTWLDFTDLVFVDPVGTGYSRFIGQGESLHRQFWSVDGDARSLSRFVAKYLAKNDRMTSPKYLVGESYGGMRAPKIAETLKSTEGVGIAGLVLISPALDFTWRSDSYTSVLSIASRLPSMAAARLERDGAVSRDRLAEVERYAGSDYLVDLLRGPRDQAAVDRMVQKVTEFTGLDGALVKRLGARIDMWTFVREFHRGSDRVGSSYDASVSSFDPYPNATRTDVQDPVLDAATAPLTSAAVDYLSHTLNWKVDARYNLLNHEVARGWFWSGPNPPQSMTELRALLASDPRIAVLVGHGFTDLVTPYFAAKLVLDQLPPFGDQSRVRLEVFPGGHMFYTRDQSRAAFRESVKKLFNGAAG